MKLQVLVSTMHQKDYSLLENMIIQSDGVIINQCDKRDVKKFSYNDNFIVWIDSNDRGLSKSRNKALQSATADICILADDDLEFDMNYNEKIIREFQHQPDADIIAFQVEGIERSFKKYYTKKRRVNFFTAMKISSVEIAFKLESIKRAGIEFNPNFGSGSKYYMGEESIFLTNCLKSGLKIYYVPVKIANIHIGNSTWFKGYNDDYFFNRGAAFTAMSKTFSRFLILQFAIRKYNLYKNSTNILKAVMLMLEGRKKYLKELDKS